MLFPKAKRVIYTNNVLEQVICQLRFPTILRIDTEVPSAFQEKIRHKFPMYQESREETNLELPEGISQIVPHDILDNFRLRGNLRFQFLTNDREWTVSLTREFVALVTTDYTCWEDFRDNMNLVIQTFIDIYAPAFFTRVGLRYQNVIDRNSLNLDDALWKDVISRHVLGPLADDNVAATIVDHQSVITFNLNNDGDNVRLQHGLVPNKSMEPFEHLYMLDSDLYCEKETEANADNLTAKLNCLNAVNRRLFNWCITDQLRDAMGPPNSDI